jgi:hypothetical protein
MIAADNTAWESLGTTTPHIAAPAIEVNISL